ncbi:MAG: hypothetical protein ABW139_19675 [Candidatus Thiodiazotropha sp. DIVDIV]
MKKFKQVDRVNSDGFMHFIFEPLDSIAKLEVSVPKPRASLSRINGVCIYILAVFKE